MKTLLHLNRFLETGIIRLALDLKSLADGLNFFEIRIGRIRYSGSFVCLRWLNDNWDETKWISKCQIPYTSLVGTDGFIASPKWTVSNNF